MDWLPKDSGAGSDWNSGTRIECPGPAGRVKRWVLHGGHVEGNGLASLSASERPHLRRLRGHGGNPEGE